jgi:serine/threonine-protein phosphatase 2B catalytic subunit
MDEDKKPQGLNQDAYFDTAIRAVRQKKPPPEIDFTLHTMDDGTQVSTQERVCKGMPPPPRLFENCCKLFMFPALC